MKLHDPLLYTVFGKSWCIVFFEVFVFLDGCFSHLQKGDLAASTNLKRMFQWNKKNTQNLAKDQWVTGVITTTSGVISYSPNHHSPHHHPHHPPQAVIPSPQLSSTLFTQVTSSSGVISYSPPVLTARGLPIVLGYYFLDRFGLDNAFVKEWTEEETFCNEVTKKTSLRRMLHTVLDMYPASNVFLFLAFIWE